jgi:hypothetical protein
MDALFYVALAMLLGAVGVTVYAIVASKEGVEDEKGFHRVRPPKRGPSSDDPKAPPFASAH